MTPADLADIALRQLGPSRGSEPHYAQPLQHLAILRQASPTSFEAAVHEPSMIFVVQGSKETVLGDRVHPMGAGECLLVSHDLPVIARITAAPYLALIFRLELDMLRELYEAMAGMPAAAAASSALSVQAWDARLAAALYRYLELADAPTDASLLGPLVAREIHYRLATAPFAGMLRDLIRHDSHASAIARAIACLRRDLHLPVEISVLARSVGMSTSSFHKHFKAITASSPLQYRKDLRLLQARRLLRAGARSVARAAFDVGYESAAHFSRDYSRRFKVMPKDDLPGRP